MVKQEKKRRAIETAIHEYCPVWGQWALMIQHRQGGTAAFEQAKEDARLALNMAVDQIMKLK